VQTQDVSRRSLLKGSGAAFAGLTVLQVAGPAPAFAQAEEEVVPWLDQPPPSPLPPTAERQQLVWEELDAWRTAPDDLFVVNHYNEPEIAGSDWRLRIAGLVARPQTLTLADLRDRPRREVDFTLECSGNTGFPFFTGAVGNARWAGASLASVLKRAGVRPRATEVVFWGADEGRVTVADNSGILAAGRTGTGAPQADGALDLTFTEQFARSMSVDDAMAGDNLLCYAMNGKPLSREHGYPVRLIAPGWYGVANVKWLTRIELRDGRFQGRFMARDYVTVREERRGGEVVWTFTTVGRTRLKSAPARVTRRNGRYTVAGVAWGAPIARVEVQIDGGRWRRARLVRHRPKGGAQAGYAWVFWTLPWGRPAPGEHAIRSRAVDAAGNVQPTPDDPLIANKVTYWESNGQITRRVRVP
jgi:DMSO/TMAO reductase YedYZ molybdopterin-dependent catalytic subunit